MSHDDQSSGDEKFDLKSASKTMREAWRAKDAERALSAAQWILRHLPDHAEARRTGYLAAIRAKNIEYLAAQVGAPPKDAAVQAQAAAALAWSDERAWEASELVRRLDGEGHSDAVARDMRSAIAFLLLRKAGDAEAAGDAREQGRLLRQVFVLDPDAFKARERLNELFESAVKAARRISLSKEPEAYEQAWRLALAYSPGDVEGLRAVAVAHQRRDVDGDSFDDLAALLRVEPGDEKARKQFIRAAMRSGRAADGLETLLSNGIDADNAETAPILRSVWRQARETYTAGDVPEAARLLALLQKAGVLGEAEARYVDGVTRKLRSLVSAAKRDGSAGWPLLAERLLALDSANETALSALAHHARLCGDMDKTIDLYGRLVEVAPSKPAYRAALENALQAAR